jgi:DNA-binding IclR family transcriptional regulator
MPLVVPREDSPPEMRILNAIYLGQLFEGRTHNAEELGMTRSEFTRALRSLRTGGAVHVGPGGRYRLSFSTSNFPDITSR